MKKLLIVDDDSSMRSLLRLRLSEQYQIFDTGDPEQALALALEHKPDAILLDLMMPKFSGFELRNSFKALTHTTGLPIFVITGESALRYKDECETFGAAGFFEKPIDFTKLNAALQSTLEFQRPERRSEVRVRMRVLLKLRGTDSLGTQYEDIAETVNVSASGFLCACSRPLITGASLDVYRTGTSDRYVGQAKVVRKDSPGSSSNRYGFRFVGKTVNWVLQGEHEPNRSSN